MVRKCAAKLLLLSLVGHVAAGALDIDQIQNQNDDEPKFVEGKEILKKGAFPTYNVVTIRELEETEFVGKMDASVILFPEPMMSNERVRRSGNGQVRTNSDASINTDRQLSLSYPGRPNSNHEVKQL